VPAVAGAQKNSAMPGLKTLVLTRGRMVRHIAGSILQLLNAPWEFEFGRNISPSKNVAGLADWVLEAGGDSAVGAMSED